MVYTNLGKEDWVEIRISPRTRTKLKELASYDEETWNNIINRLLRFYHSNKKDDS